MSISSHTVLRPTRLRDFGAFQADISTLATREFVALDITQWQELTAAEPQLQEEGGISSAETVENLIDTASVPTPLDQATDLVLVSKQVLPIQRAPTRHANLAEGEGAGKQRPYYTGSAATASQSGETQGVALTRLANAATAATASQSGETQGVANKKKWLSLTLRVGCTLLLLTFLGKSVSWSNLVAGLAQVRHGIFLMGLIVGAFGIVVSSYQWRSLLHAERIQVDLAELIDLYLVGVAFSHFLPTGMGGDAVKAVYVGRESGNSAGSASAVVMSRITGFIGMLLLAIPILILWHSHFTQNLILEFALLSLLVGGMMAGVVLSGVFLPRLFRGQLSRYRFLAPVLRIGVAINSAVRRPRFLLGATLFGIEFWIVGCLNYYSYANALGLNVPLYFYFVAIPFISLITFLPISINGFGVRESAFVYIFSTMHVPATLSLLLALLMDAQVLLFGVIGGCIYLAMNSKHTSFSRKEAPSA